MEGREHGHGQGNFKVEFGSSRTSSAAAASVLEYSVVLSSNASCFYTLDLTLESHGKMLNQHRHCTLHGYG